MKVFMLLLLMTLPVAAQQLPEKDYTLYVRHDFNVHSFFDRENLKLQGMNVVAETGALLAIQSADNGGGMAPCLHGCTGALAARGRTWDPFEKHFESYGYGWGSVYRYGGGVGLNMFVAYMFHATNHHKLERWVPMVAIAHADSSIGYALTGSSQGVK